MTVQEISLRLGVDEETVRRWIRRKQLTAYKESNRGGYYISRKDYKAFIKDFPKYVAKDAGDRLKPLSRKELKDALEKKHKEVIKLNREIRYLESILKENEDE